MPNKLAKKNYIYNLLYQILTMIIPVITMPYLARVLGAYGNGVYGYTISITSYFILFGSLGISLYGQREIAYNRRNKEKTSIIFWELFCLKFVSMLISLVVYCFIFVKNAEYGVYYKILIIEIIGNILDISFLYQGFEDFKNPVIRNILVKIITLLCIFIFVKTENDLWKYILIHSLSIFIANATLWLKLKKYITKVSLKKIGIFSHLKPTIMLFIPQIAIQIYVVLDKTMIGYITGSMDEVGYYEQSQKILKLILTIVTTISVVMLPRVASYFAEGKRKEIKNNITKSLRFSCLLSFPMVAGIIIVSNNFIPLFLGPGYDKAELILPLMSPIIIFISISSIIGNQYLLPIKKQKEYTLSVILGAVLNVLFNFILIHKFGSIGACLSTIIAELSVTLIQVYFVKKDFDIMKLLKLSKNYLIASVIMFVIMYPTSYINISGIWLIIVQSILGSVIYVIILIVKKDTLFLELINETKKIQHHAKKS